MSVKAPAKTDPLDAIPTLGKSEVCHMMQTDQFGGWHGTGCGAPTPAGRHATTMTARVGMDHCPTCNRVICPECRAVLGGVA